VVLVGIAEVLSFGYFKLSYGKLIKFIVNLIMMAKIKRWFNETA